MSNQISNESTAPPKQVQQHKRALEFMKSLNEVEFYNELKDKYVLSQKFLELNGFPMTRTTKRGYQRVYIATEHDRRFVAPSAELRNCLRCQKMFNVNEYSMETKQDHCIYHWGKKPAKREEPKGKKNVNPQRSPYEDKYFCCGLPYEAEGCSTLNYHVHNQLERQSLVLEFKRTPTPQGPTDKRSKKVYSLDCEMVFTTGGCEVARVVIIDWKGDLVLDYLCRPENEIVDYNTFFSGITKEMMAGVSMSLNDVKRVMFRYINQNTILIGHSLEFDLRALKLVHHNVVDTSMLFHVANRHSKHSLKALSKMFMGTRIQENGHCPIEDSMAALNLVYVKVDFERRKRLQRKV